MSLLQQWDFTGLTNIISFYIFYLNKYETIFIHKNLTFISDRYTRHTAQTSI